MKVLVVLKNKRDNPLKRVCNSIKERDLKIKYSWKNTLSKQDLKSVDMVISIGGDGTALSASHYIKNTPILIVNKNPDKSMGALSTISINKLNGKLHEILKNSKNGLETEKLERIQVRVNNKPIKEIALNDIFLANEKAYLISKYEIKYGNKSEKQFSSGLIFSTGTGSTAWFKSAGGKPFPSNK